MPPELAAGLAMMLATAAIFWFIGGALRNRTRAARELARLSPLLERLGADRVGRWVAPGTLRIVVERGRGAIARVVIVLLLEPREMNLLWLVNRWRGRRDLLVIRGDLRREPRRWVELFRDSGTIGREVRTALARASTPLEPERALPGRLVALAETSGGELVDQLWAIWSGQEASLLRVATRPDAPHLVVAVLLGDQVDWERVAAAVSETAELVVRSFSKR